VNPTQFGANEDFSKYPRDLEKDILTLNKHNVDVIFVPEVTELYPAGFKTWVKVNKLSEMYCGKARPGHFRGVATIVTKLVNIVQPDAMYLGEKDYQQVVILERTLADLNYSTKIVRCPIIRETDGLAMSSRNVYLNKRERVNALCLHRSLNKAKELYAKGVRDIETVKTQMVDIITKSNGVIDYIVFVNNDTLAKVKYLTDNSRILLAVRIGNTRLIDNVKICQ
jgi:pantoate--beta-alanine ligase